MAEQLRRMVSSIAATPAAIRELLEGGRRETEEVEPLIDLSEFRAAVQSATALDGSEIDRALVGPLHRALPLTRRDAADPRLWQWLALVAAPDLVWKRWWGSTSPPSGWQETFTPSRAKRFGCAASLNGISRNTFARLWWVAESLEGDYDAARSAIANQDLFQAVFERRLGLYPPAARACLSELSNAPEATMRDAVAWLQFVLGTTVLQALDEEAIVVILREQMQSGRTRPRRGRAAEVVVPLRRDDGTRMDAHFRVESVGGTRSVHYQSSGGRAGGPNPRNLDYQEGLTLLLRRLAGVGGRLERVLVDSEPMRDRPVEERVATLEDLVMPVEMETVSDFDELRKTIVVGARKVGQDAVRRARSGGSSRALCLWIGGTGDLTDAELQDLLAGPD